MGILDPFGSNINLASLARRYYWTAAIIMLLAMSIGLLEGLGVGLLIPLLSTFSDSPEAHGGGAVSLMERIAQGHSRNERLLIVSSMILLFVFMKSAFQIIANTFASWVDGRIGHEIRCALSERLQQVGYAFYLVQDPARLMNVLGTESWKASDAVRILLTQIAASGVVLVFSVLLLLVSWRLSVLVIVGGLLARAVQKRTEARLRRLSSHTVSSNQVLADRMLFATFGARVIRLFDQKQQEHERFKTASDEVRRAILRTERMAGTQGPVLEAMHGVLFVVVLLFAVYTGTTLPVLAAFLVLMNRLQPHLRTLEQTGATFASASGHFNEVEWLLIPQGKPLAATGDLSHQKIFKEIAFENVTFDYGERGEPALNNASFVLRHGRATALIGGSGAGKSTVINLLCRLLEPDSGTIRVGGQPLSSIRVSEWLRAIAIAGQDIDLIDGSIAENIAYGRPDIDRTRIEQAARAAHATFVDQLPQGLETLVGSRGLSLSGGQRQRIGIARALAREPEVLILDEATNAVDHETEAGILQTLQHLRKDMTLLVVSHRMSTLSLCDDAVVLHRGQVVKAGPLSSTLDYYVKQARGRDFGIEADGNSSDQLNTEVLTPL